MPLRPLELHHNWPMLQLLHADLIDPSNKINGAEAKEVRLPTPLEALRRCDDHSPPPTHAQN